MLPGQVKALFGRTDLASHRTYQLRAVERNSFVDDWGSPDMPPPGLRTGLGTSSLQYLLDRILARERCNMMLPKLQPHARRTAWSMAVENTLNDRS